MTNINGNINRMDASVGKKMSHVSGNKSISTAIAKKRKNTVMKKIITTRRSMLKITTVKAVFVIN